MLTNRLLAALLLGLALLISPSCQKQASTAASGDVADLKAWVGQSVIVQFRRDALGAAADLPVNPRTSSINGAETCVFGKILDAGEQSLVLEVRGDKLWIPRGVILMIELNS